MVDPTPEGMAEALAWINKSGETNQRAFGLYVDAKRAEIERLRAANEKLVADLAAYSENEVCATCEGCAAPLFSEDDYVSNDDMSGCWAAMTDLPSKRERPCYAYRVGKVDARTSLLIGRDMLRTSAKAACDG